MNPIQIQFQGIDVSPALRNAMEEDFHKLLHFAPDMISAHAIVSRSESRHRQGNRFLVTLRVTIPGGELHSGHGTRQDHSHEDPFVAARDSFRAMRRQLEDRERMRRGDVKHHEPQPLANILQLDTDHHCGLLVTDDGREIAFHENSLVDADFHHANVGDRVRYVEVPDVDGPRASTVHLLRHQRHQANVGEE
jgi:ribosome-associated translation inhibitor RaiA